MKKVIVDEAKCIRCGACMSMPDSIFTSGSDGESIPLVDTVDDDNKVAILAMEACPTGAIILEDVDAKGECNCPNCECNPCECGDDCGCGECECEHCDCNHEE